MCVCAWLIYISFFPLLTYRFRDHYFVCAIGGQHDGHLPFWLPGFVKVITTTTATTTYLLQDKTPTIIIQTNKAANINAR